MRKSFAVLSAAIAPIILVNSSASAGLNMVLRGLTTEWPNSSNVGGPPVISSGTSTAAVPGGPMNYQANQGVEVDPGVVLAQTFTTPGYSINLGAISLQAGGGGPSDTSSSTILTLFQLNNTYTPTSGGYNLSTAEMGNELLGGGNGLGFNLLGSSDSIYEFDLTGADQVPLAPNTSYALELWTEGNSPQTFFHRPSSQSYTGGQAYFIPQSDPTTFSTTIAVDHSSVVRGQLLGGGTPANLLFAVYPNTLVIPGPTFWNQTVSGNWNVGSNWSSQAVPSGAGAEADFLSTSSTFGGANSPAKNGLITPGNVYTDIAQTVGIMNFDNANGYVLDGAGSLTLAGAGSNAAVVNVLSGSQEINLPLTVASNTTFNVSSGATLSISDPTTINTGVTLTSNGGVGTVTYQSIVTVQGSGSLAIGAPTIMHGLALAGSSSTAIVAPKGANVNLLQLDSLTTAAGSKLDLSNNAMILHGGPVLSVSAQLTSVTAQLKAGFNNGLWNGTGGIDSSAASADTRFLTALGSRQSNGSAFDGVNTTTNDVLVKYTYYGDADLNGVVNGADYTQIDSGFGGHLTGWQNGDFNYDGVVNGLDYALIDNTFNQITATGASPLSLIADSTNLISPATSAVPEPTTLGLLGIGALSLLARRRRTI